MIEFDLRGTDLLENVLFIENDNSILCLDAKNKFKFIECLYDFYENKNTIFEIYLGNKSLKQKELKIVDFLNVNEFYHNKRFEKGTIFYDYLIDEIRNRVLEETDRVNSFLDEVYDNSFKDMLFSIDNDIDVDLLKLYMTFSDIDINLDWNEFIDKIPIVINRYVEINPKKNILILYDKKVLDFKNLNLNSVYSFGFNGDNCNILIGKKNIETYNEEEILQRLSINYPSDIDYNLLLSKYSEYMNCYRNNVISTNDEDVYIINKLLNEFLLSYEMTYTGLVNNTTRGKFINDCIQKQSMV